MSAAARTGPRRWVGVIAALQVLVVVAVSCGVPTGESTFEPIERAGLGDLNESTSTTTTIPPTTTISTTLPEVPVSTVETPPPPTTEPPPPRVPVQIYFIARGVLQPVELGLPPPLTSNGIVAALEAGPPDDSIGLESFVAEGLIVGTPTTERGVLTVQLDPDAYARLGARLQFQAVAQMVLTLTSNLAGVGQVTFLLDDEPTRVPTDGASREVVTQEDFESLQTGPRSSAEPSGEPTTSTTVAGSPN